MYCIREDRTWDTVFVDIPAITHPNKIEEVARIEAAKKFGPGVFMLYNSMDDEVPEMPDTWIITVQDDARAEQYYVVEGANTEEEALLKMGEGKRSEYGDDHIVAWLGANDDDYEVQRWPG
jgi:hypothetical protein